MLATEKFDTVLGKTWFENGLLSKDCHMGEIGQWQNGVYEVVGPTDKATAEFMYPKPAWPAPPGESRARQLIGQAVGRAADSSPR